MTQFPHYDTIEFEQTSNVSANDTLTGGDFSTVKGSNNLSSNEIFEVERIELLPPTNSDGSIQTFEHIRLQDGTNYYPHIYMRSFMLGWDGASFGTRTPAFGVPVLSNKVNPSRRPILTACPKFGPSESVNISVKNDGNTITDDFTVRVSGWRFKGNESDLENYFASAGNLSTSIQQNLSLSNPFKDKGDTFPNKNVLINSNAKGGAHNQFTKLTGGDSQDFPKVYPWATWAENSKSTQANTWYNMGYEHENVDNPYQSLYHNFEDGNDAAIFDYAMVSEGVTNLKDFRLNLESRPTDAESVLEVTPNDLHELPFIRRLDGTSPSANQVVVQTGGPSTVTSPQLSMTSLPLESVDRVPRRLSRLVQPVETVVWNDEGGVQIKDDGTELSADAVKVGVMGYRLELNG